MIALNVEAEVRAALLSVGVTPEEFEARAERAVERVLARRAEQLEPLSAILGISAKAASARLSRDPHLRHAGVQVGARCLFKRSVVESYYSAKSGAR